MYDAEYIDTLKVHLEQVLEVIIATFESAGISLPTRRYITFGLPVHDCEQLTVSLMQLYLGPPGDQAQQAQHCEASRTAALSIEISRCIPVPNNRGVAPGPEALTAMAEVQAVDAWMLMAAATSFNPIGGILADVAAGQAQGGFQATVLSMSSVV